MFHSASIKEHCHPEQPTGAESSRGATNPNPPKYTGAAKPKLRRPAIEPHSPYFKPAAAWMNEYPCGTPYPVT